MSASANSSMEGIDDGRIPSGVSALDVIGKLSLFVLAGLLLYLGTVESVPISFYNGIIGSMLVGFLTLSTMGESLVEMWADVKDR